MKFSLIALLCLCISNITGQIVINEYSASNLDDFRDDFGKTEDWIELHNASNNQVDISGWYLSDKIDKPKKWKIPAGTIIEPSGFILFWASGRDIVTDSSFHTNFKFTQTNNDEYVVLTNNLGTIIESTPLTITQLGHSIAKDSDGNLQWQICIAPTPNYSNNDSPFFIEYSRQPKIQTTPGFYKDSVIVFVDYDHSDTLRYTLNGDLPTQESPIYTGPLTIKSSSVLSVRCFSKMQNVFSGLTDYATFFINEPSSTLPIISVGAGQNAILLANGDRELRPFGSCEVFTNDGKLTSKSYGELDRHGQDSWVNDQRSLDWISRDEMGHDNGIKQKLFSYSQRDEFQRIILRASGDDNYPSVDDEEHIGSTHIRDEFVHTLVQQSGMHMDIRALERYLLYINGQYWGVYTIREKPDDHDYTEYRYNQDKYDLQFLKTWGTSWVEYGDEKAQNDWTTFRDYVLTNDVSKTEVYNKIESEFDVISLMDYMIANLTCVSSDWLNYNTGWWRGLNDKGSHKKWGYIMWDNDATFDYYINYSGVPDTSPDAKACDIEGISEYMDEFFPIDTMLLELPPDSFFIDGQWIYYPGDTFTIYPDLGKHEKIFLKLLDENTTFRNLYLARYADMLNTTFSCTSMLSILDSLESIILPEMPRHINRWGGSMTEWKGNIKKLKDFIQKRCEKVSIGLVNCYDLTGPEQITLITDPPNAGNVRLNTITHQSLPWTGAYFGNMVNQVEVIPTGNKKFVHWKSKNGSSTFSQNSSLVTNLHIVTNDTLIAVFEGATMTDDDGYLVSNIHPNPASNTIEVTFGNSGVESATIQIISLDGKFVVLNQEVLNSDKVNIDVSHLHEGSYILKIQTDHGIGCHKLVIFH